jgi:hypothetical protein
MWWCRTAWCAGCRTVLGLRWLFAVLMCAQAHANSVQWPGCATACCDVALAAGLSVVLVLLMCEVPWHGLQQQLAPEAGVLPTAVCRYGPSSMGCS